MVWNECPWEIFIFIYATFIIMCVLFPSMRTSIWPCSKSTPCACPVYLCSDLSLFIHLRLYFCFFPTDSINYLDARSLIKCFFCLKCMSPFRRHVRVKYSDWFSFVVPAKWQTLAIHLTQFCNNTLHAKQSLQQRTTCFVVYLYRSFMRGHNTKAILYVHALQSCSGFKKS